MKTLVLGLLGSLWLLLMLLAGIPFAIRERLMWGTPLRSGYHRWLDVCEQLV